MWLPISYSNACSLLSTRHGDLVTLTFDLLIDTCMWLYNSTTKFEDRISSVHQLWRILYLGFVRHDDLHVWPFDVKMASGVTVAMVNPLNTSELSTSRLHFRQSTYMYYIHVFIYVLHICIYIFTYLLTTVKNYSNCCCTSKCFYRGTNFKISIISPRMTTSIDDDDDDSDNDRTNKIYGY